MLSFVAAVFFLIITPGPGVLSLAGVGAAYGYRAGLLYLTGLCFGNAAVGLAVVTGLAAILLSVPVLRVVLAVLTAAYLLYLAYGIARAGATIAFREARKPPGFVGGVLLQLINPKAYAVNTVFFTSFAFWPGDLATEVGLKLVLINIVWLPLHGLWLWAGISLRRLVLSARIQRRINILMALALALVALLAMLSL